MTRNRSELYTDSSCGMVVCLTTRMHVLKVALAFMALRFLCLAKTKGRKVMFLERG